MAGLNVESPRAEQVAAVLLTLTKLSKIDARLARIAVVVLIEEITTAAWPVRLFTIFASVISCQAGAEAAIQAPGLESMFLKCLESTKVDVQTKACEVLVRLFEEPQSLTHLQETTAKKFLGLIIGIAETGATNRNATAEDLAVTAIAAAIQLSNLPMIANELVQSVSFRVCLRRGLTSPSSNVQEATAVLLHKIAAWAYKTYNEVESTAFFNESAKYGILRLMFDCLRNAEEELCTSLAQAAHYFVVGSTSMDEYAPFAVYVLYLTCCSYLILLIEVLTSNVVL